MSNLVFSILLFSMVSFFSNGQLILLSEDFETSTIPIGWTKQTNATDGGWNLGNNEVLQSQWWTIASHGNFIGTNDDACDCDKSTDYLITPSLDFSGLTVIGLQFENYFDGGTFGGATEAATIEYSTDNGLTWNVLQTITGTEDGAWDSQFVNLSSLAGNANVKLAFRYNDNGGWMFGWAIDDVLIYTPTGLNLALMSVDVNSVLSIPQSVPITGTVTNLGNDVINSFDIQWIVNGDSSNNETISNLSISPFTSYNFTHNQNWQIDQSGVYDLTVAISNINNQQDYDSSDDTLNITVQAIEFGIMNSGGIDRNFIYYHPSSAAENCPLVFVCHGYGGNAEEIMEYSKFNALADEFGFAVCYPQGIEDAFGNTFFNVGYDFQSNETVNDVQYLIELNDFLQNTYSLNSQKVFCTGMSNGGDLCYLLACEASEVFRAVAPISGMILQDIMNTCEPSQEVPILEIHGTNDDVTFYNGDPNNIGGWGAYPSMDSTVSFFTNKFQLSLESTGNFFDIVPTDGSTVSFQKYGSPTSCAEVWLYAINQGGHDWPGAFGNMDIEASREAWLFFNQLCENVSSLDSLTEPESNIIIKKIDLMGREIKDSYSGIVINIFSDGSTTKTLLFP